MQHISVVFPRLKKWRERYEEAIECGFDLLPNEIVFQHGPDFAVLYVLVVEQPELLTAVLRRQVFRQFQPSVDSPVCDFECIFGICFDLSYRYVFVIVCNEDGIHYGNKYTLIVEAACYGFITATGILHNDLRFTGKTFQVVGKLPEVSFGMTNLIRFSYHDAERLYYSNCAFIFGYVDSYCVHLVTPAF